jgi:hypothetical protein
MPRPHPRLARIDEVDITRQEDAAEISFHDGTVGSTLLKLGPRVAFMTDAEILEAFNDTIWAMKRSMAEYHHVAVEVPPGRPQISYSPLSDQWVPRGHVLRCYIDDGGSDDEAQVEIDDRVLSLREFGRLLSVHAGWGMRIVFVPDDRLTEIPEIDVREPDDE